MSDNEVWLRIRRVLITRQSPSVPACLSPAKRGHLLSFSVIPHPERSRRGRNPQLQLPSCCHCCRDGMLSLSAPLCCHWRHSRCTFILPPGAIQSCHLIRSGRLPNPALRDSLATPVAATGSKVRIARFSETTIRSFAPNPAK